MIVWTVRSYSRPLTISVHKWRVTVPALVVVQLWDLPLLLRAEAKKTTEYLSFSAFLFVRGPSSTSIGPVFSLGLLLLLTCFTSPFLVSSTPTGHFQLFLGFGLACHLLYLWTSVIFLEVLILLLDIIQSFFSLSSKRSSLLSQAGLLSLLPDLWHNGMACSQTFQQWFFKTDQHSWRPQKHIPRGDCKVATWVAENLLSQNTQQKLCWTFFSLH